MFTIDDFLSGRAKTLGWGVLAWCSQWLVVPDRDDKGATWEFTTEQVLFILNFYAVKEDGRWHFTRAMLSRPKGWGKSPVLAAIACAELLGPVRFSHWHESGQPIGKRVATPHVILAAVTMDQAMKTTMVLVREMLAGKAEAHYGLDIALTRVRTPGGGLLEPAPTHEKAAEGLRPTFVVMDETHHWIETEAVKFAGVIRRNLGKGGTNRSIESTNAPVPGEGSVAEDTDNFEKRIREGLAERTLLYDSAEIFIEDIYVKEAAFEALKIVYGDSTWIDLERIWEEICDPALSEADARRFYFNQRVLRGSQWLNPKSWLTQKRDDLRLKKSTPISLGFRGQTRNGACALVATDLNTNAIHVLKVWETHKDSEIPYVEVDEFVRDCLNFYNVKLFFAAPQNWQDIVGRWYEEHEGIVEEFWTNQKLKYAKATEEFETAVYTARLIHDGSEILKHHIDNCLIEELANGMHIPRKASTHSDHYISAAEAAILSFAAAQEAVQRGLNTEGPSKYVYSW